MPFFTHCLMLSGHSIQRLGKLYKKLISFIARLLRQYIDCLGILYNSTKYCLRHIQHSCNYGTDEWRFPFSSRAQSPAPDKVHFHVGISIYLTKIHTTCSIKLYTLSSKMTALLRSPIKLQKILGTLLISPSNHNGA